MLLWPSSALDDDQRDAFACHLATVVRAMPVASAISRAVESGRPRTAPTIALRFAPRRARPLAGR